MVFLDTTLFILIYICLNEIKVNMPKIYQCYLSFHAGMMNSIGKMVLKRIKHCNLLALDLVQSFSSL